MQEADEVTLGVVQFACTADVDENVATATRLVREAAARGENIVYFSAREEAAWALFPPSIYADGEVVMPDDLVFEATGIAQFPLAVWAAILTVAMLRRR